MKKVLTIISLFPILPTIALAQTLSAQGFIKGFLAFSNKTLIPALLGIAFLLFVINVIRFFVIQGSEEDGRENAKNLALYSVLTFVVLIVFWGVVNLFANSLGFGKTTTPTPDYLKLNGKELKTSPTINQGNSAAGGNVHGGGTGDPIGDIIENGNGSNEPVNLLPPQYEDGSVSNCSNGVYDPATQSCL